VSPLAYLADLLKYATENIKNNNAAIKASDLAAMFHQPFDLPASCEAADTPVRQVRLCIEVLRSYLGARPLGDVATETQLAVAERQYRLAAYTALLTKLGTSYAELRLSRSREPVDRQSLADRLGIDLSHLSGLFLEPETLTEAELEQRFGLADTTRAPFTPLPTSDLQTWRLASLRTLWQQQDFPTDPYEEGQTTVPLQQLPADLLFPPPLDARIHHNPDRQQLVFQGVMTLDDRQTLLGLSPELPYQQAVKHLFQSSQRLPFIDPDLLRPEDFRHPVPKANPDDPNQAFDLWQTRRDWVSDRLQALANLTKVLPDEAEPIPDLAALFDALYQPVLYGASSVTPWASTTPSTEFAALHDQLKQGIEVPTLTFRLQDELNLSVEQFTRLMELGKKAQAWEADTRHEKVKPEEWQAVYSILIQAQKVKLFAVWRKEEQDAGVQLDAHTFWIALRPLPEEQLTPWRASAEARHRWQQTLRDRSQPALIDPDLIGLADLKHRDGDPAYDLWNARTSEMTTQLAQLAAAPQDLAGLETNFQATLGISVPQVLAIAADQAKGHGVSDRLAQLSLEGAEFNHVLRIARLLSQAQPVLPEEWEAVYSILVQVWKRRQFARWRTAEKAQNITLSPDFFQMASPVASLVPTANAGWRSSIVAYRDWQDKLQARIDQQNTTLQALAEAVSATEEATLTQLRDGLILAISHPGDLETKAKWVAENLLIDARMSACSMTTRVAQAIETLQGLILALRTGQLEERYRALQLNLDDFEEKWKWLGSYASWRAAMFVFLYPENILQPSLRRWQTPAFETLVRNTSANRKLTVSDARLEAKKYSEYFQDICTLRVEASCYTRTRLISGYRNLFYMFGRGGLTGKVYWSAYDPEDKTEQNQTFWIPVSGVNSNSIKDWDDIIGVIGATPYQIKPDKRYIYLFARKASGIELVCARYDLENRYWLEEALKFNMPFDLQQIENIVAKQQISENAPPQIIFDNPTFDGDVFSGQLDQSGSQWQKNQVGQTFDPLSKKGDFSPFKGGKIRGCIAIKSGGFFLVVTDITGGIAGGVQCYLFLPNEAPRPSIISYKDSRYKCISLSYEEVSSTEYLGSGMYDENSIYIVTGSPQTSTSLIRVKDIGSPYLDVSTTSVTTETMATRVVPVSGIVSLLLSVQQKNTARIVWNPGGHIGFSYGGIEAMPYISEAFDIPFKLSAQESLARKSLIKSNYISNTSGRPWMTKPRANLAYLEEAYYFVPIHWHYNGVANTWPPLIYSAPCMITLPTSANQRIVKSIPVWWQKPI
jgi:hypothetical protein